MKIALWAPVEETVPPRRYGGTELVVANLAKGLVEAGHEVFVLCSGDSKPAGHKTALLPKAIRVLTPDPSQSRLREMYKDVANARALSLLREIKPDIIHNHTNWRAVPLLATQPVPSVSTVHYLLSDLNNQVVFNLYRHHPLITISNAQRRPYRGNYLATIYNGIDVEKFPYQPKAGQYLAFLGRMSPDKGPLEAIRAARSAGIPLIMAAKVDGDDQAYYNEVVKPHIDGKLIKFIGEVDHRGKCELLKNALALMALVQWEEPFGLFMVEAMACGTPVIASRRGSVPELIVANETGLIVQDRDEKAHVRAISEVGKLSRQVCRDWVAERFSIATMTKAYLHAYAQLIR